MRILYKGAQGADVRTLQGYLRFNKQNGIKTS